MDHIADRYRHPDEITPALLFPGHDGNRPPAADLSGREFEFQLDGRAPVHAAFGADRVEWSAPAEPDVPFPAGVAGYEAMVVHEDLLGVVVDHPASSSSSLAVIDLAERRALILTTTMVSGISTVAERTVIREAGIDAPLEEPFPKSADLVGKRVQWRYSDTHRFEHLYVEPELYMWHGIAGPEAGMGGAEPSTTRLLRPGVYLFSWSEHAAAFNGAIVIDATGDHPVSAGRLVQWDAPSASPRSIVVGAQGEVVNVTRYA